ncbi:MAG: acyl-CoA dehydrogenase family protein [Deltaproteobacteria bacterium]|nr:acyl-CoA dehydrogenase family protein [Deltaproteobacteria bacterium]
MAISFELTDEQKQMQETARKFAVDRIRGKGDKEYVYRECEMHKAIPDKIRKDYVENGFPLVDFPEDLGGLAQGTVTRAIVEEEIAWGDAGMALGLDGPGLGAQVILELGSAAQKKTYLGNAGDPSCRIALAISEKALDDDTFGNMATTVKGDVISGEKRWVYGARDAKLFVVIAKTGSAPDASDLRAFVVEAGAAGLAVGAPVEKCGLRTIECCNVKLENVKGVALEGTDIQKALTRLRILIAARLVGVSTASADYAAKYAQERPAFGKMIGQFQSVAFMVADAFTETNSARWLVWKAAALFDKGLDARLAALQALAHAADVSVRVANDCVQVLGGAGFIEDYPAEKWLRDSRQLGVLLGSIGLNDAAAADIIVPVKN